MAYIAAGLAEWDRHVSHERSSETDAALELLFALQSEDGSFSNLDCWPPLESSDYHGATVAALAVTAAPDWIETIGSKSDGYAKLVRYLKTEAPPHDYGRVLKLWVATKLPEIMQAAEQKRISRMIVENQHSDGGWSLRDFSKPENWGSGNRAAKLRSEKQADQPESDGHMTGLAVLVLRKSGMDPNHPSIAKGIEWLTANQRESGRWWTRSLNTDKAHYITFSGTCYPLLALQACNALRE